VSKHVSLRVAVEIYEGVRQMSVMRVTQCLITEGDTAERISRFYVQAGRFAVALTAIESEAERPSD